MKNILKYQSLEGLFFRQFRRVREGHHWRSQNNYAFFLYLSLLSQLVNQVIIFIFIVVVIIYEVFKMVFASRSPMSVMIHVLFEVFTAELEGSFAGFDDLLTHNVALRILFFYFLLTFWLIVFTYNALVGRVI